MKRCKTLSRIATIATLLAIFFHTQLAASNDSMQYKILQKAHTFINATDSSGQVLGQQLDSIISLDNISDSLFTTTVVRDIGNYFRFKGEQSIAIEIFSEATNYLENKNNTSDLLLRIYLPLGAAYEEVGLQTSAMEYYHKALHIAQNEKREDDIARIYNNIGVAYFKSDPEKAEEYFLKSIEINKKLGEKNELFLNYSNLGAIRNTQKRYSEALEYALSAMQLIDKEKNSNMYYVMQRNIALMYLRQEELHLAISYLNSAKKHFEERNDLVELSNIYTFFIEIYTLSQNHEEAQRYAQLIEYSLLPGINNPKLESRMRISLSDYYEKNGNYPKAYKLLHEASILKDSLTTANDTHKLGNLERIYDYEQKLRENARTINEMEINKINSDRRVIFIITALIALVVISVIIIIHTQLQNKLHKTTSQLAEQQIALQEKEKELQQIKEAELNRAIDQKNRELSSFALSYTKNNEFLANLNDELKQLFLEWNPREKVHKERIRNILSQLKQQLTPDNWQEFRYYFEQVHPSFYDHLEEICPDITQRQKRLCAMLYIGLSTKEISTITFREVRSIESARNRLRKKLEVPAEETIQEFLSRKLNDKNNPA